ncbi:MAG: sulfoacetaldehyde acetyltransferase [Clostridiales bacterium]|nr:sulfoacetaldehyde acetyltransferase [Peptococcus niger]MDU7244836.1 sulfoacetaldehyde acetyltransferase [Clostridiales bacterium]
MAEKQKMTPSEAIVEQLRAEGVEYCAGIVGSAFMDMLDLFPDAGIRFIACRDEHTAGHMMDAYNRVSGKIGVCTGQNGPGITNLITSIATAYQAHSPVLVIGPSAGSASVGWDGFQEVDQVPMFKPITKKAFAIPHPSRAADCVRTAFRVMYADRGPVYLDVPRDYFYGELEDFILPPEEYRSTSGLIPDGETMKRAAEVIANAKRPVIISGRGVVDSNALDYVEKIAEYLSCPVATTYLHNDAYRFSDPHWVGPIGYMGSKAAMYSVRDADVILAIGCRLSYFGTLPQYDIKYFKQDGSQEIVQIDVQAKQIARTHPVKVGIVGDARVTAEGLLKLLQEKGDRKPDQARLDEIKALRADWDKEIKDLAMEEPAEGTIHPRRLLYEMMLAKPEDCIVTTDIGNVSSTANSYLRFNNPRLHVACLTNGNTGFAFQAALGAKLAAPDQPVMSLAGDGAWGMSFYEVMTAVQENLPVVAVVFRNNAWCAEKKNQVDFYNDRYVGCEIEAPSWAEVAKVMGAEGIYVDKADELAGAFKKAFDLTMNEKKTVVLEVRVDGTKLAPPFRKDALKLPVRFLDRYKHLDYREWKKD